MEKTKKKYNYKSEAEREHTFMYILEMTCFNIQMEQRQNILEALLNTPSLMLDPQAVQMRCEGD